MSTTEPYCNVADLLFGNIPVPASAVKYVAQAAEEIDSIIGMRYATPVVVSDNAESRPTRLILKKLNVWLATGRCIMAVSGGGEDDQVHAYGKSLVDGALEALVAIGNGTVMLPGADPVSPTDDRISGPSISNVDATSRVEAFSSVFGNPATSVIDADRAVYPYSPHYNPLMRGW